MKTLRVEQVKSQISESLQVKAEKPQVVMPKRKLGALEGKACNL